MGEAALTQQPAFKMKFIPVAARFPKRTGPLPTVGNPHAGCYTNGPYLTCNGIEIMNVDHNGVMKSTTHGRYVVECAIGRRLRGYERVMRVSGSSYAIGNLRIDRPGYSEDGGSTVKVLATDLMALHDFVRTSAWLAVQGTLPPKPVEELNKIKLLKKQDTSRWKIYGVGKRV